MSILLGLICFAVAVAAVMGLVMGICAAINVKQCAHCESSMARDASVCPHCGREE